MRHGAWLVAAAAAGIAACGPATPVEAPVGAGPAGPAAPADRAPVATGAVEVVVHYGSEKQGWFDGEIAAFNATPATTPSGRFIKVVGKPGGSGEAAQAILDGRSHPHVFVPASSVNLHNIPALPGPSLARSPLVIAMWRPMAEELGWPERALGWDDLVELTTDPDGWASRGHPEWGLLKLGHTHPRHASSGLLALLAEAYAGAGKVRDLTPADLDTPATRAFMTELEESVVHYGRSTGFFAEQMLARGPAYLSAAVLYENLVIESQVGDAAAPLVAIQPSEGTLWADHPYAIIDGPWVGADERAGARAFLDFLQSPAAQARARAHGFRAADGTAPAGAPFDLAHGVDPAAAPPVLPMPDPAVLDHLFDVWARVKKASTVILVLDKSGSMHGRPLAQAKAGARAFLASLEPRDQVAVSFFDDEVHPLVGPVVVGTGRDEVDARIAGAVASGGTALNDAIAAAYDELAVRAARAPHRIYAVVVLSDGQDTDSELRLSELRNRLSPDGHVRIFTLGYGGQARADLLQKIAGDTGGFHADGDADTIVDLYRETATLF